VVHNRAEWTRGFVRLPTNMEGMRDHMLETTAGTEGPEPLDNLVSGALRHLKTLRYSALTIRNYGTTWRSYVRFALARGVTDGFCPEIAEAFLADRGVPLAGPAKASNARHLRAAMKILNEFGFSRCFHRRRDFVDVRCSQPDMSDALETYTRHCLKHQNLSELTMQDRRRRLVRFLRLLEARGHVAPATMTPTDIQVYFRSRAHLGQATVCGELSSLRSFIRVGFALGFLGEDLSVHVPRVPTRRYGHIPSVWKPSDVDAMLRAVDRGSPVGKRDYAVLLLAARLGLRAGDIRSIRLDDIDWEHASIAVKQRKTSRLVELPMTDEVAVGLIDYLRHGRPAVDHREVFVRLVAPFRPFHDKNNLYQILTNYRRLAGVTLKLGSRQGLHSLRHSIATALLADGVPIEQISPILGHASIDTTRIYTHVDIAALRSAGLDPDGAHDE
jgi:site-specific recombinase XerD